MLAAGELGRQVVAALAEPDRFECRRRLAFLVVSGSGERANAVSTFSRAVRVGMRLKLWKTKPISWARMSASFESPSEETCLPPSTTEPEVGLSRAPSIWRRVDFPPPVGPWIATI
ncbi:hypothetical protein GCM10025867_39350 [Frondihabitans sucicola]|uniref:Uncharacterized protein n=1 Tax=Frondihabitans sucicola TaxID=1268041 RepID=A0ABM8GTM5_9MICO|nr:hypothetical protein GCM10025867_39350 [Frondihabitans sucicola]